MAFLVDLPDGRTAEFPDSMSQDEIHAVVSKKFPKQELSSSVLGRVPGAALNVAKDIGGLVQKAPGAVARGILNIPKDIRYLKENAPAAGSQIINEPGRAARNAVAGLADIGHATLNAPRGIADYLAHIGMINPETAQKVPMQKDISSELSQFVGEGEQPGDELLRGTVRNIPNIIGAGKALSVVNPLKMTYGNIAKNVLKGEKEMKAKYSGPNGLYENLANEAEKRGINKVNIDPRKIDLDTIKEYSSQRNYASLQKFLENPDINNAQRAVSEMGSIERRLENKTHLIPTEQAQLKAAKDAKAHIQENMFKDQNGNVHEDLLNKHRDIQKGYATEVVPYTTNRAIKAFKKNEMSPKELFQRISKGKFAAQRGKYHKPMKYRKTLNTGTKLGVAGETINLLLGRNNSD